MEDDRSKGNVVKAIIVRCRASKAVFAHSVPFRGAGEHDYVVNRVVGDIVWLGHTELALTGGNERSLQALVERVMVVVRVKVQQGESLTMPKLSSEKPPAYDSQPNGAAEVGVLLTRRMFRMLELSLEHQIEKHIPIGHALVPWLVEHTAPLLNVKARGQDGFTSWARVRGRPFSRQPLCYAEQVLYKLPSKGPLSQPVGNMGARWLGGTFLG